MFMNKSRPCRQHVFVLSSSRLGIHRRFTHLAGKYLILLFIHVRFPYNYTITQQVNSAPTHLVKTLRPYDWIAVGLFASSLAVEVLADYQKSAWRKAKDNKEHDEKFISSGLWGISRHPKSVRSMPDLYSCGLSLTYCR